MNTFDAFAEQNKDDWNEMTLTTATFALISWWLVMKKNYEDLYVQKISKNQSN